MTGVRGAGVCLPWADSRIEVSSSCPTAITWRQDVANAIKIYVDNYNCLRYITATMRDRRPKQARNVGRVILSVPLRKELHGRLKAVSEAKDLPMISLIRIAIGEYIDREAARE
jgi:hypothetical protein